MPNGTNPSEITEALDGAWQHFEAGRELVSFALSMMVNSKERARYRQVEHAASKITRSLIVLVSYWEQSPTGGQIIKRSRGGVTRQ